VFEPARKFPAFGEEEGATLPAPYSDESIDRDRYFYWIDPVVIGVMRTNDALKLEGDKRYQ
jgi:hypothetical protein